MSKPIICMSAPVAIKAAETGDDGKAKGAPRFDAVVYTGGPMNVSNWDKPVVLDLDRTGFSRSIVANLDHDGSKEVGHVTGKAIQDGQLSFSGEVSRVNQWSQELSASTSFPWQASIEADPVGEPIDLADGDTATVNGQEITGPAYIVASEISGFAFLSRGADSNTTVKIAATAESSKEKTVDAKLTALIKDFGFDPENVTDEQLASLKASFAGEHTPPKKIEASGNPFEARKIEAKRCREIRDICDRHIELRHSDEDEIVAIEKMHDHAIDTRMDIRDFRLELAEAMTPHGQRVRAPRRDNGLNNRIVEAAVCQAARMKNIEDHFDERTLQAAHTEFKGRIGLKQVFLLGAEENGYQNRHSTEVDRSVLKAAFAPVKAGFSTLDISEVVSNTANKFIMRGWNSVDQTCLRIAKLQNVRDFKTITTVSLTDSLIYEKVGAGGEIPHGTLSELTYTNKADTYARMLAITRQDIINDDLGALTDVPMKLGNGAMKKLNDIFWTEFLGLVGASFFAAGNNNINTGVATMTEAGLDATYVIFKNQTNPDSTPLGAEPEILLVPTALEGAARRLMASAEFNNGTTNNQGSTNIWAGRFEVLSSPYISNSSYTGNTAVAWWMLANPEMLPVIAIAALNGQVEPTVDTAEADFNVLGVQMRGYSDVGVADQEYRGGVHADGGAS